MNASTHDSGCEPTRSAESFTPHNGAPPSDVRSDFSTSPLQTTPPHDLATVAASDAVITRPLPVSQWFGKYQILAELGHGGMGVVYKARDTMLGRVVALKRLRGGVLASPQEIERFALETKAAAKFEHPNIITLLEVGEHNREHYFTMPYLPGGSLVEQRKRLGEDPRAAVAMVEKVARAVQYLHDHNILHRDLKPANVLLDEQGEPKVADFGLAKFLDTSIELTPAGQMLGTYPYMSPEQITGRAGAINKQSDVWALGVMLYELLTGRRPFLGTDFQTLVKEIPSSNPPRPHALQPRLDTTLESIVLKCLEKESSWRYTSAQALVDDLGRWSRGESVQTAPRAARAWRSMRKHPLLVCAIFFSCFLVAAVPYLRDITDPDYALKRIEKKLHQEKVSTLIGSTGMPEWLRWQINSAALTEPTNRDGTFTLQSFDLALCELLPSVTAKRYRLEGEVRHEGSGKQGTAGIYVMYHKQATSRGMEHCFAKADFADFGLGAGTYPREVFGPGIDSLFDFGLRLCIIPDKGSGKNFSMSMGMSSPFVPERKMNWRKMAVEVTDTQIRVQWDGEWLPKILQRDEMIRFASVSMKSASDLDPAKEFPATGGLGLFLRNGTASYRNVRIVAEEE